MKNIKHNPRMKRMKLSHIMREYDVTQKEAAMLRGGQDLKEAAPKKVITKTTDTLRKESTNSHG